ncbi:hypothetical protein FDP25_11360 [Roseovarius sp. A21]|uniref:Uncharacterized protein n=1 Tax=Roseovarius bejariae TaxID=2576383 RepID=A0A844CY43_9RHOB|nr:hypothetical protein [Roseovarius bejariae]MRU16026.1 hypothetical protein [Roseovarius bejariae]
MKKLTRAATGAIAGCAAMLAMGLALAAGPATPSRANEGSPLADAGRMVTLARLCLSMETQTPDGVHGLARAAGLRLVDDPLPRLEDLVARQHLFRELETGHASSVTAAESARTGIYPFGDPDPMMAFADDGGWLLLVATDATVMVQHNRTTGAKKRFRALSCHIHGDGWTPDSMARDALAGILGEGFGGHRTSPSGVSDTDLHTIAHGGARLPDSSTVSVAIESWRGANPGADGPGAVTYVGVTGDPVAQAD